jgi:hypothetical protein
MRSGNMNNAWAARTGRASVSAGTASGKQLSGVNVRRSVLAAVAIGLFCSPAAAQSPGAASFRIVQRGALVGSAETALVKEADGWRVTGTNRIAGSVGATVKQFDARYDARWHGRFLTVETQTSRGSTVVHAVAGRSTAHVDVVTAKEARWRSHSVSPDTVFLPEFAVAAYEAVAARLHTAGQRAEIPLLLAPDGERRAIVDAWERLPVKTRTGIQNASRHTLTFIGIDVKSMHVWVDGNGRLLRVDLPSQQLSFVRSDVVGE